MKLKHFLISMLAFGCVSYTHAAKVNVTMNAVSTSMTLYDTDAKKMIDTGEAVNKVYSFEVPAGEYLLTAYGTDSVTVNGTIILDVADSVDEQNFSVITNTVYVTNKNDNGTVWSVDNGDYDLNVKINTKEGVVVVSTLGNSITSGRNTFLAFVGNSYNIEFIPSDAHKAEGYTTLYRAGTLTANLNISGTVPLGQDYSISVPDGAELALGIKFTHFTDFTLVEPKSVEEKGGSKIYTYYLAQNQVYNYRTWKKNGLTHGGYFTVNADKEKTPVLTFTDADFSAINPKTINHDVNSNQGYETGDIFVNINERGHLDMNVGDTFFAHAMRSWELTDNSTNNYFIEPDFHYTVIGVDGKPSTGVIEIQNADTNTSAWSQIKAVGPGTAIVLVSYDAIALNYYSGANKSNYMGGEFWGAIWPENTGVYVVTVGEGKSSVLSNMVINDDYNTETKKLAGKFVDAEHDVFYYLDSEVGAYYTFTPQGVSDITIAYPTIGEQMASYSGFYAEGVTKNNDGSYTLLLKEGRQIVKLTDASGKSAYQVLTAKKCHREISNASRPGSLIFQPGDKIKIQYSGLRHPANKLAGIYNMSAYVTYNGIPNGSSLIQGSGQYTFGSSPAAQAVTIDIPEDYDAISNPEIVLSKGVIQVNGFGDPIGNHRNINHFAGRSPNFTAIAHKTYFGAIPDLKIALSSIKEFDIRIKSNVPNAEIMVYYNGNLLSPDSIGNFEGTYGTYRVEASMPGYRCYRNDFTIADDASGIQWFDVEMVEAPYAWDGISVTEPKIIDSVYQISSGAELAWFAGYVNEGNADAIAVLTHDIDLGDYTWTPIGFNSTHPYSGTFEGNNHQISGLYINNPSATYQALFGYLKNGSVSGVSVSGTVSAKQYVAGVVAYLNQNSIVDRCANFATVSGTSTYVGGVVAYLSVATAKVSNSYNVGTISGTSNCGGVIGSNNKDAVIGNIFSVGEVLGTTVGACVGGTTAKDNLKNAFSIFEYNITASQTLVSSKQMESGEIAYKLGEAFGQKIGFDIHPVIGGEKVLYNSDTDTYYNDSSVGVGNVVDDCDSFNGAVYYNLQGIPATSPYKGINIVRLQNGSVRKILVK